MYNKIASLEKTLRATKEKTSTLLEQVKNLRIQNKSLESYKKNHLQNVVDDLMTPLAQYVQERKTYLVISQLKILLFLRENWKPQHFNTMLLAVQYALQQSYKEQELYLKVDLARIVWRIAGEAIVYAEGNQKLDFFECFLEVCYCYAPLYGAPFSISTIKKHANLARQSKWNGFLSMLVPRGTSKDTLEKLPEISHKYILLADYYDEQKRTLENRKKSNSIFREGNAAKPQSTTLYADSG